MKGNTFQQNNPDSTACPFNVHKAAEHANDDHDYGKHCECEDVYDDPAHD